MKKQGRHFVILLAVLAVLAAGYFCLRQYNNRQQEIEANQIDGEVLVDIAEEEILSFSYVYEGETYAFEKIEVTAEVVESEENGEEAETAESLTETKWVSAEDPSLNLTQSRLETMAGKLANVIAQDTITDVTDLSQYGLEEPANVLHWETAENSYTYYVGEYNSFGSVYYVCEPDSDTVYTVASSQVSGFSYSLEDLIEEEEASASEESEESQTAGTEEPEATETSAE